MRVYNSFVYTVMQKKLKKVIHIFSTICPRKSTIRQKNLCLCKKLNACYPQNENFCGYLFLHAKTVDKNFRKGYNSVVFEIKYAPLAQLDRALVYGTKG